MKIPTLRPRTAKAQAPAPSTSTPIQSYRDTPGHLADAGNGYAVLPYALIDMLPDDQQQNLVDVLDALAAVHPAWRENTAYQVLAWAPLRLGDLDEQELAWHGISSDVDPLDGSITYHRGYLPLAADTVLGHRPAVDDCARQAPGARPGARPPLLPAPPTFGETSAGRHGPRTERSARLARAARIVETRRRRAVLSAAAPDFDPEWAAAVASSDELWTAGAETWQTLMTSTSREQNPHGCTETTSGPSPSSPNAARILPSAAAPSPQASTPPPAPRPIADGEHVCTDQAPAAAATTTSALEMDWGGDIDELEKSLEDLFNDSPTGTTQ